MTSPESPISNGPFERREDGPWWVRVMLWFLAKYGLPSLVAVLLALLFVWLSVGDVKAIRTEVSGTKSEVTGARADLKAHNEQMIMDAAALRNLQETQIRILQAMCYNAARSDAARASCAGSK